MTTTRAIAIDLFSGCGGMSLGLESSGFNIAAAVEIDPIHASVHHYNFPYTTTICKDIALVSGKEIKAKINNKEIDLVAGSPPCQSFSMAGKRDINDPRNNLIFEFARIVFELTPKYFLFENVAGLMAGQQKELLYKLVALFQANNYSVVTPIQILNASVYGVPQQRKRLILMGHRNNVLAPKYPNPTIHSTTVKSAIADLSDASIFVDKDLGIAEDSLKYSYYKNFLEQEYSLCHKRYCSKVVSGHLGSKHTEKVIRRFSRLKPGKKDPISRFLKLSPDGVCNTLRAGTPRNRGSFTSPRPIHYQHPRCLTIREAARLQSFPDWFQFHRTIWHGFREIGNSVCPLLAKALGQEFINCLSINQNSLEIENLDFVNPNLLTFNLSQAREFWQISKRDCQKVS